MRSADEYRTGRALIEAGMNDCAISRETGIPRTTIREWRWAMEAKSPGRTRSMKVGGARLGRAPLVSLCFLCDGGFIDKEAYAYLLGVYLGDGHISPGPRGVFRLRVTCDLRYPEIINEIATNIAIVRRSDRIGFAMAKGCVNVYNYWKHWPCVFPQHGPGRKHERRIELASWQMSLVDDHPEMLVRGLIQSDGNRHLNRVRRQLFSGRKTYLYPRYMFTNASTDILEIFVEALDRLGVHWTKTQPRIISVARAPDVAFLDSFVGPKR